MKDRGGGASGRAIEVCGLGSNPRVGPGFSRNAVSVLACVGLLLKNVGGIIINRKQIFAQNKFLIRTFEVAAIDHFCHNGYHSRNIEYEQV